MNYITVAVLCILGLLVAIISLFENELFSKRRKKQFAALAILIIFEIVLDTISFQINGKDTIIHKLIKIIEFIAAPFIPMLMSKIVAHRKFWTKIKKYFTLSIVINVTLQVITFFAPFMFTFDENLKYKRTVYTSIYIFILILSFILFFISSIKTFIQNANKYSYTLLSMNVVLLCSMLIRAFVEKSNADWLCLTLGYFIFKIYFTNGYMKIDNLTSLLNQGTFKKRLLSVNYTTAIIVIDANDFKAINDKCGHSTGDKALIKIAETIFNVYGNFGDCFRIGGDEFAVILKPQALGILASACKSQSAFEALENLTAKLDSSLAEIAKVSPILKHGVSQGYSIYYSPDENPSLEMYNTMDEVFKLADFMMYQQKQKQKTPHKV